MTTIQKCNMYILQKEREKRYKAKLKRIQSEIKTSFQEQLKTAITKDGKEELEFLIKHLEN